MESVAAQLRDMAKDAPVVASLRLRALAQSVEAVERKLEEQSEKARNAVLAQLNHRCPPTPCPNCQGRDHSEVA